MLIFGLIWVTSWISYFFSSIQSLPPSFPSRVFPDKISTTVGRLLEEPRPFFIPTRRYLDVWSHTLLPAPLTKLDWGGSLSVKGESKPLKRSVAEWNPVDSVLCRHDEKQLPYSLGVDPTSLSQSSPLIEDSLDSQDFLPDSEDFLPLKILRSLQNIFRWPQGVDRNFGFQSSPVVVVHNQPSLFQVWVKNHLVATLPDKLQAKLMQQRLKQILRNPRLDASQLRPALVSGMPAIVVGNRLLFVIDKEIATQLNRSRELIAIEWSNNLRIALDTSPLTLLEGQIRMYGLVPTDAKISGLASWYGPYFHGRLTATGETFNQNELTAAHPSLPFDTFLKVTNLESGNAVIVRVNDRGPYVEPRTLDLSREAARCINSELEGVIPFEATIMEPLPARYHDTQLLAGL